MEEKILAIWTPLIHFCGKEARACLIRLKFLDWNRQNFVPIQVDQLTAMARQSMADDGIYFALLNSLYSMAESHADTSRKFSYRGPPFCPHNWIS